MAKSRDSMILMRHDIDAYRITVLLGLPCASINNVGISGFVLVPALLKSRHVRTYYQTEYPLKCL